ncbi:MAG: hypothetical protein QM654_04800 [Dysgonamonadaceae bacterium]
MKHLIFIILLSLAAISTEAQTVFKEKITFTTSIGSGLSMSTPSSSLFTWQVMGHYALSDKWLAGAGTGLSSYEKMLIPLYGDVRFQIGRERKLTPFAELAMGYSFAPAKDANGGVFANPSFGMQFPLKNKNKLQLSIGYQLQALERVKTHTDNYLSEEFEEKLNHQSISFKFGLRF